MKSGNYYNVTVPGASSRQGSITSPINTSGYYISGKKIEELSGHNVTVKGYFNGLTSQGKYVTIILTDIVDNGSSQGGGDTPGGDTPGGGGSDVSGNTETVDFSAQGYENAQAVSSFSGQNFTISFDKGTNSNAPKYYNTGNAIRCYGSNSFTISSSKTITGITLTFASGEGTNEITVDKGSYSDGTWTGSASSVTFTVGGTTGHRRIAKVAVTIEE